KRTPPSTEQGIVEGRPRSPKKPAAAHRGGGPDTPVSRPEGASRKAVTRAPSLPRALPHPAPARQEGACPGHGTARIHRMTGRPPLRAPAPAGRDPAPPGRPAADAEDRPPPAAVRSGRPGAERAPGCL